MCARLLQSCPTLGNPMDAMVMVVGSFLFSFSQLAVITN